MKDVSVLLSKIEKNTLGELYLTKTSIVHHDVIRLIKALKSNISVQYVDLSFANIGHTGARVLADALNINTSVKSIYLQGNELLSTGVKTLASTLQINTSIQDIDLGSNNIGDPGVQSLADALNINTSIRKINMENNRIGPRGAQALADALRTNTSLISINLEYNGIGKIGLEALFHSLKANTSLQCIYLGVVDLKHDPALMDLLVLSLEHNYVIFNISGIVKESTINNRLSRNKKIQECLAFLTQGCNNIYQSNNIVNAIRVLEEQIPELKDSSNALPTYITERYLILQALACFVRGEYENTLLHLAKPMNDKRLKPFKNSVCIKTLEEMQKKNKPAPQRIFTPSTSPFSNITSVVGDATLIAHDEILLFAKKTFSFLADEPFTEEHALFESFLKDRQFTPELTSLLFRSRQFRAILKEKYPEKETFMVLEELLLLKEDVQKRSIPESAAELEAEEERASLCP